MGYQEGSWESKVPHSLSAFSSPFPVSDQEGTMDMGEEEHRQLIYLFVDGRQKVAALAQTPKTHHHLVEDSGVAGGGGGLVAFLVE